MAITARPLMRKVVDPPLRARDADAAQQLDRPRARLASRHAAVAAQSLRHLVADRPDRIEAGHRILKDHGDVLAANLPHRRLAERHQVAAGKAQLLGPDGRRRRRQQPQHGAAEHRLAAARLADDAERLAGPHRERDVVVGHHPPAALAELDHQVLDLEQRIARCVHQTKV
jgi:hypothetical protein